MNILPYLLLSALLILPLPAEATPRTDERMCEEVAEAVYESVTYELLTQQEAEGIVTRCYELFVS